MNRLFFRNWWNRQVYHKHGRRKSLKEAPNYIGISTGLRADPEYITMTPAERGLLLDLFLLAAQDAGHIPANEKLIARAIGVEEMSLRPFEDLMVKCGPQRCPHMPEGYDYKGNKTSWARRGPDEGQTTPSPGPHSRREVKRREVHPPNPPQGGNDSGAPPADSAEVQDWGWKDGEPPPRTTPPRRRRTRNQSMTQAGELGPDSLKDLPTLRARRQGFDQALEGEPESHNPHPADTEEYRCWSHGWDEAQEHLEKELP